MKVLANQFLDFFLPRFCAGCEKLLAANEPAICEICLNSIKKADDSLIEYEFERKFKDSKLITDFTSLYIFEKDETLQQIIHKIKYGKQFRAAKLLGNQLANGLGKKINSWAIDLIIPIPLHHLKKAERGFNQSDLIARGIGEQLNLKVCARSIKRVKYTESQTTMNLVERENNIADAFKLRSSKQSEDKNVLIVDDIITTGATIRECVKVLLAGGASNVYACSVAITGLA